MKRYRVLFNKNYGKKEESLAVSDEEVYADGWRADHDNVFFFRYELDSEEVALALPKGCVMRIQEINT